MITLHNFYEAIKAVDINSLPPQLQEAYQWISKNAPGDKLVKLYERSEKIRGVIDDFIHKLNKFLSNKGNDSNHHRSDKYSTVIPTSIVADTDSGKVKFNFISDQQAADAIAIHKPHIPVFIWDIENGHQQIHSIQELDRHIGEGRKFFIETPERIEPGKTKKQSNARIVKDLNEIKKDAPTQRASQEKAKKEKKDGSGKQDKASSKRRKDEDEIILVENLSDEINIVKRYLTLEGAEKTISQVKSIYDYTRKAVRERRVTRQSEYADEIQHIIDNLTKVYKAMLDGKRFYMRIDLAEKDMEHLKSIVKRYEVMYATKLLTAYLNMDGHEATMKKAEGLHKRIETALSSGKRAKIGDKYIKQLEKAQANLERFMNHEDEVLEIEATELSGLGGLLGIGNVDRPYTKGDRVKVIGFKGVFKVDRVMKNESHPEAGYEYELHTGSGTFGPVPHEDILPMDEGYKKLFDYSLNGYKRR